MRGIIVIALILSSAGCSVKRIAVNKLGDALSSGGSSYEIGRASCRERG